MANFFNNFWAAHRRSLSLTLRYEYQSRLRSTEAQLVNRAYGLCSLMAKHIKKLLELVGNLYTGPASRGCITSKEDLPIVAMETCKFASHSRGIHSNKERNVKQEK